MLVTLGALFAGQYAYRSRVVEKPLAARLGSITGVRHAYLQGANLMVQLKPNSNLMTVYQHVIANSTTALGHAPAEVVIQDYPNARLKALANNISFAVAQG